jgi:hypothetical protein
VNRPMTLVDRLRIERVLWTVDILIYDIRTRGRRTIRRELRANLQAAAQEMGAGAAIWQLGPLRRLARGYLDAQYGRVPFSRAGWPRSGGAFVFTVFVEALIFVGLSAFLAGVQAGDPAAHRTYVWNQLSGLGMGTFTARFTRGQLISFEGTLLAWPTLLGLVAALIIGGRLWRVVTRRLPRRSAL